MGITRGEVEGSIRANRADRTGRHAEFAGQARIEFQLLCVPAELCCDEYRAEQDKAPELWVNHIPVNAHSAEPRGNCYWFVRHHPHPFTAPAVGLHRKRHRWIERPDSPPLQPGGDAAGDTIHQVARVVELRVRDGPRRTTNVVPVHPHHKTDQAPSAQEGSLDVRALLCQCGTTQFYEADIIRAGVEAEPTQPVGIEN